MEKVRTLKGEIAELILDKNMNKLKDIKSIGKKKRDIAQILTVVRQKQMLEELEGVKKEETERESGKETEGQSGKETKKGEEGS